MLFQVKPILETAEELLNRLTHKADYLPVLAQMHPKRQCEWLAVRVLLLEMVGEEKAIAYTASGKPYLPDGSYRIGISHTQDYVALAIDRERNIAIDIERIAPRIERLHTRFMSAEEIRCLSPDEPLIHILLHWSAKETLVKYLDDKSLDFKTQLYIHPFLPLRGEWGVFGAEWRNGVACERFRIRYFVALDYVLTVCCR
jgi:4'-phosphopantetheinyl transferase EntD